MPDNVGLSRYPPTWWTLNCKYNAAYDVHRLNTRKDGRAAVDESCDGKKLERFLFVKDNPDIVTYMLALRTGLTMHIVMPSVVPHSLRAPYMSMSRFETGPHGNPHYHGFSVGTRGPRMNRVRADVDGVGDEPLDVDMEIRQILEHVFGTGDACQEEISEGTAIGQLCKCLPAVVMFLDGAGMDDDGSDQETPMNSSGSDSDDGDRLERMRKRELVLAKKALEELVAAGYVEVIRSVSGEEGAIVGCRYRKVSIVPQLSPEAVVTQTRKRCKYLKEQERVERALAAPEELNIFKDCKSDVRLQSTLEKEFARAFGALVSEWNPCYADDGRGCRYKWDDEIGAHDVEVDVDEVGVEPVPSTSEERAIRGVPARWPERLRLRALLDDVFAASPEQAADVDLQRVRRLVAALVNRCGRHTIHPKKNGGQSWVFTRVHEGSHPALFVVMASLIHVCRVAENDLCDWKEGRRRLSGLLVLHGTIRYVAITKRTCFWRIWEMWTGVHALIFGRWCSM